VSAFLLTSQLELILHLRQAYTLSSVDVIQIKTNETELFSP
jgi:hypothetical protein